MNGVANSTKCLILLSEILLGRDSGSAVQSANSAGAGSRKGLPHMAASFSQEELLEVKTLADSHHVTMRTFPTLRQMLTLEGNLQSAEWAEHVIETERARIHNALSFLEPICGSLEEAGKVVVIKSLDHWPDLGSDLDLYADANGTDVVAIMRRDFQAQLAERSWGDRLANKWNFVVPGLPELVEVHVGRLGQTGEQIAVAQSLVARSRPTQLASHVFQVPAPEERLVISTLQRMYRHFYIRLCDIIDNARLIETGAVDYLYLRSLAQSAGLWDGLATYLVIISDYVKLYRGEGLQLPDLVRSAARFGGEEIVFRRNFLRIPLLPHSAKLYASELTRLLLNGEIRNTLRLSLLPGLATAAALELKLTGSDKGIW
jgi:hypothetical protein